MDTHELLRRLKDLPVIAADLTEDMLAGNFRSVFKGQGMEFDEARHYQWGDDARLIDWNASARLGTPFVKMYREERELTILLLLDTSASMRGGMAHSWGIRQEGQNPGLYGQALIAAALIAFSAEKSGQRVGAFLFDREIERVFPPLKGRRNVLMFISGALQYQNRISAPQREQPHGKKSRTQANQTSNLRNAIAGAGRLLKRRSMVVLISDFLSVGWEQELCDLCRRHDVIAIRVNDPLDEDLPDLGLITIEDPETGIRVSAPTGSPSFLESWNQQHMDRAVLWQNLCRRAGAARLDLPANADAAAVLKHFFSGRSGR
jgi:uncharacterized protein (DUF58 family)